jgi:hypothetical protein
VSDDDELRALSLRYARAVDRREKAELRTLFAPAATVVLPASITRGQLPEVVTDPGVLIDGVSRFVRTRHDVVGQTVTVTGDTATGETACQAHHFHDRGGRLHDYQLTLRYADSFVRAADGWRFSRRELQVDRADDTAVDVDGVTYYA